MKPIQFSPHAEANLKAREINRAYAQAAICHPARTERRRPPRSVITRPFLDAQTGETMVLRAVIEEFEDEIVVVTLCKSSKLKKYLPETNL